MYDPVIGRFLSPDPFVQAPGSTQNYNRYSYCMNNPMMFTDPSGYTYEDLFDKMNEFLGSGGSGTMTINFSDDGQSAEVTETNEYGDITVTNSFNLNFSDEEIGRDVYYDEETDTWHADILYADRITYKGKTFIIGANFRQRGYGENSDRYGSLGMDEATSTILTGIGIGVTIYNEHIYDHSSYIQTNGKIVKFSDMKNSSRNKRLALNRSARWNNFGRFMTYIGVVTAAYDIYTNGANVLNIADLSVSSFFSVTSSISATSKLGIIGSKLSPYGLIYTYGRFLQNITIINTAVQQNNGIDPGSNFLLHK